MSRFGKKMETESNITHSERLEFLGDAVVEFLTSIHLFHMFPDLEEGGLATYRAAIVQNQYLAVLAKVETTVESALQCSTHIFQICSLHFFFFRF
jgi:ribonuclease-3